MEIKLYDNDLAAPTYQEDITEKVQHLKFSTKLHGGFHLCSFGMKADLPEAWEWLTKKIFYRIVITDVEKTVWEGRIQDPWLSAGMAGATAYGYYSSLNDGKYQLAYNAEPGTVIKAVLTAQSPSISADQTNIDAMDTAVDSAADASYRDISPRAIIEKIIPLGDSGGNEWYFAIWEDRVPYLKQRSISTVDWNVSLIDLNRFVQKYRGADLWNKVYAIYDVGGVLTRTADAQDTDSQTKYNLIRYYAIQQLGTVGGAGAAALAARDRWLAEHKDVWSTLENITIGDTIYDTGGVPHPSSWLRAGEVIRVLDLVPATGDLDVVARNAQSTFYVLETQYDLERRENRIIVDSENRALDSLLARKL